MSIWSHHCTWRKPCREQCNRQKRRCCEHNHHFGKSNTVDLPTSIGNIGSASKALRALEERPWHLQPSKELHKATFCPTRKCKKRKREVYKTQKETESGKRWRNKGKRRRKREERKQDGAKDTACERIEHGINKENVKGWGQLTQVLTV